jgi:hypothetical protein
LDSDFADSDYDFDEDHDQFKKHVDEDVTDDLVAKGSQKFVSQPELDIGEEEIDLLEEMNGGLTYKWKTFNKLTAMHNPTFKLGIVFSVVKELRVAIAMYCVRNRRQLKKKRNNKIRVEVGCRPNCNWKLIATKQTRKDGSFVVTKLIDKHDCERVWEVKELTATMIAEEYLDEIRDNENLSLKSFAKKVQKQCNMRPNRFKLARAKLACLKKIRGDEIAQYGQLWDYAQELRTQNPGSKFILKTIGPVFSCLYMCIDACKRGWLKGCRPIICLDGTHIKTKFGGQLLTAIGVDGNDQIYPIAWAIVEVECYSSWKWFLTTLKQDLSIMNTSPFTIMSDKQKVHYSFCLIICNKYEVCWRKANKRC